MLLAGGSPNPAMLDFQSEALAIDVAPLKTAGLRYVSDQGAAAIRRKKVGKGFFYLDSTGKKVTDPVVLKRVRSLAVPPAWTEVWICPTDDGHIQATGRDAKLRKQYRYHLSYREMREDAKYEHLLAFAEALPKIRSAVAAHLGLRGVPRPKVLATVVHLLETTLIRVGNEDYARQNKSYGLTTLKNRHVKVDGAEVRFQFMGKSGRQWSLAIRDRRVAKIIRACQDLPGQDLLQYRDEASELRAVTSGDINAYLREISGAEITAKNFRTWAGSVLMARFLSETDPFNSAAEAKRNVRTALARLSKILGNTPSICRKCYVHPAVLSAYFEGRLIAEIAPRSVDGPSEDGPELRPDEIALLALLAARAKY